MKKKWDQIAEIATYLGASKNNLRKWRQTHVPHSYRTMILIEAKRRGYNLSKSDLTKRYARHYRKTKQ